MPVCGAMDGFALRCANRLIGNPDHAAALEVTAVGPELQFDQATTFAVTGAEFRLTLNGHPVLPWTCLEASPGSSLRFGQRIFGARTYVAMGGGIDVPLVMGSRATHLQSRIGGLDGRALRKGDVLNLGMHVGSSAPSAGRTCPLESRPGYRACPTLHIIPGPHADRFHREALEALTSGAYQLTSQSNRMGYRLDGPALNLLDDGHQIISEATPLGSIQIPPNRQPILLMVDRQPTGGYPMPAIMMAADLPLAAQLLPGDRLTFVWIDRQEAVRSLHAQHQALDEILPAIRPSP
jgi:antagonist of KipI